MTTVDSDAELGARVSTIPLKHPNDRNEHALQEQDSVLPMSHRRAMLCISS